ncbi:mevalonate kinase [Patescibacteria group bacterium]|nr:mevalonate kinase [Patescibacteria group bacterium]MBU1931791.1 mevalonate kinase [Patescibacteria group bacterium]
MIKVSAPGKVIISGEHSVVYGQPALLAALDKRCWVTIKKSNSGQLKITDKATDDLRLVKLGVKEVCQALSVDQFQLDITLNNQVPIGSGLGSSAAMSVSLAAGICQFFNPKQLLDKALINHLAFKIEKHQHGNPSGGDNTICTYGGVLKFQKKKDKFQFCRIKPEQLPDFLLVNTGQPEESTKEMVVMVNSKDNIKNIGEVTGKIIKCFKEQKFNQLKALITQNQRLLEKLGVVGQKAQKLIQLIELEDGAAKICGAGGVKRGSGFALAYSDNLQFLAERLKSKHVEFKKVNLGGVGVRVD